MKLNGYILILVLLLSATSCAGPQSGRRTPSPDSAAATDRPQEEEATPPTDAAVRGNTQFALDLYRRLAARPDTGNLFFSPLSIRIALAMTWAGAKGPTADQIAAVMHFPTDPQDFHPAFGRLESQLNRYRQTDGIRLLIANALWLQQGFAFKADYLSLIKEHYSGSLRQTDFQQAAEAARREINAWVEEKTSGRITELIGPSMLSPLTRLVLTNAVYFKGDWARQFSPRNTRPLPFTVTDCSPQNPGESSEPEKISVATMQQTARFAYGETDRLQILRLPYTGNSLSMIILLPKNVTLCELTESLSANELQEWIDTLREREVEVYLPRFEMDYTAQLGSVLSEMGMPLAFTPAADLTGMANVKDLHISGVVHKAWVKVTEEGTEAAAATGVTVGVTAAPAPPPVFRADHPFLFLIYDEQTHTVLFLGRLVRP